MFIHRDSQLDEQGTNGATLFELDSICMVSPSCSATPTFSINYAIVNLVQYINSLKRAVMAHALL
jgi:hypothetical protein